MKSIESKFDKLIESKAYMMDELPTTLPKREIYLFSEETNLVIVEGNPDAADDWIAERVVPGDIVVTNDIPLVYRCILKESQGQDHEI